MNNNIFCHLLNILKVKHTETYCRSFYEEHPHKNNLYGLSRMLSAYKIDNIGVRLEDKMQITDIECPFIAYKDNDFVIVEKVDKKVLYWWKEKQISLTLVDFINSWSGIVLIPEATQDSIEPNYPKNKEKNSVEFACNFLLLAILLSMGSYALYTSNIWRSVFDLTLLCFIICGLFVSFLLVQKHLYAKSRLGDKICSLFSKTDCNNILDSDASTILGVFTWSEIGFSYFISILIVLLFQPELLPYIFLINIGTTPYTLWSVWYQYIKVKQWCPLCLISNGVLVCITIMSLLFFMRLGVLHIQPFHIFILGLYYLLPLLCIHWFIKKAIQSKSVERITFELNSIKSNRHVIEALLAKQPYYEISGVNSQIIMGNPNAKTVITILTNPHCNPCAKMHTRVTDLLAKSGDRFCVQYIYASFHSSKDDSAKALIAAYFTYKDRYEELLLEWFSEGKHNPFLFFMKYDLHNFSPEIEYEYNKHTEWKEQNNIYSTPYILVNGHPLPENYQIEDLLVIDF